MAGAETIDTFRGTLTDKPLGWMPVDYTELQGNVLDLGTGKSDAFKTKNSYRVSRHTEGFYDSRNLVTADAAKQKDSSVML